MTPRPLQWLKNRFVRDVATLQVASVVNQACQVLSTVSIALLLGARGQGLFVSAIALQALLHLMLNVGTVEGTAAQIAAAAARGNREKTAAWIAFVAKLSLILGAVLLIGGWLALPWVGERLLGDRRVGIWAAWLSVQPLLELPRGVAAVAFQGTRRMRLLAQLENAHQVLRLFLVVTGAIVTGSARGAVLGQILAGAMASIVALELFRQARRDGGYPLPGLREVLGRMPGVELRRGVRLVLRLAVLKNAYSLFTGVIPRLAIGAAAEMSWVSYFHIAQRILSVPISLLQGVSRTMLPAMGELAGLKEGRRLRGLFLRTTLISGGGVTGALLFVLPLIPFLVRWLLPDDYAAPVFHFSCILALGYIPQAFAVALLPFVIVTNQIRAWYLLSSIGAVILLPISVWLVLELPRTGAAWSVSLYHSWVLVLLGYTLWFLAPSRWEGRVWTSAPPTGTE